MEGFWDCENGFFYGIPYCAPRAVKLNPLEKSLSEIGPDLGGGAYKWLCGVRANNGKIYCAPFNAISIFSILIPTMAQWNHLIMSSCQRPVITCGQQGHFQLTKTFTTCHPMPVGSRDWILTMTHSPVSGMIYERKGGSTVERWWEMMISCTAYLLVQNALSSLTRPILTPHLL